MEKLDKLQINSERIMKNEELVTSRGGYGSGNVKCNGPYPSGGPCEIYIQEMDGTADIITEENRLIYKFINPLRALVNK